MKIREYLMDTKYKDQYSLDIRENGRLKGFFFGLNLLGKN